MAVRVKLKLKARLGGAEKLVNALVNSGFETEAPQLLIPVNLARELQLHPPPPTAHPIELGTAGGPARLLLVRDALEVWLVTEDREVGPKTADALISPIEEEALINDKLIEELGIVILAAGSGKWRIIDDPPEKIRYSERPQYW